MPVVRKTHLYRLVVYLVEARRQTNGNSRSNGNPSAFVSSQVPCSKISFLTNFLLEFGVSDTTSIMSSLGEEEITGARLAFQCPNCSKCYLHKCTLMRHLRFECGWEPRFRCTLCGHRCKRKENLRSHMVVKHHVSNTDAYTVEEKASSESIKMIE